MARSASHPLGPCDCVVKTLLPECVNEKLVAVAVMHGLATGEYVRNLIIRDLLGSVAMMRMAASGETGRPGIGTEDDK